MNLYHIIIQIYVSHTIEKHVNTITIYFIIQTLYTTNYITFTIAALHQLHYSILPWNIHKGIMWLHIFISIQTKYPYQNAVWTYRKNNNTSKWQRTVGTN